MIPHWGFEDGEEPAYGDCGCGMTLRVDRLDLVFEHDAVCTLTAEQRETDSDRSLSRARERGRMRQPIAEPAPAFRYRRDRRRARL